MDVQTDVYLEELTDTVPESDAVTQTDAFLDRPPTPLFVPQKTGVDVVTQIENGEICFEIIGFALHVPRARQKIVNSQSYNAPTHSKAVVFTRIRAAPSRTHLNCIVFTVQATFSTSTLRWSPF
jgi:hypothetical protein